MAAVNDSVKSPERLHALDSLRGVAMFLGIVVHGGLSMGFWLRSGGWIRDIHVSKIYDAIFFSIHGFRMQLFFLLAGFFGALVYKKKGPKEFLKNRAMRVGLPFLVGMFTLAPLIHTILLYNSTRSWQEVINFLRYNIFFRFSVWGIFSTVHLWFLYYLLIIYLLMLLLVPMGSKFLPADFWNQVNERVLCLLRSPWKVLILAFPLMAILSFEKTWDDFDRGLGFYPSIGCVLYYGLFFTYGWWMERNKSELLNFTRHYVLYFILAIPLFWAVFYWRDFQKDLLHPDYNLLKFLCVGSYALYGLLMVFALMGWFLRFFSNYNPRLKYLSDSAYWVYLVHLPVIMILSFLIRNWTLASGLKFLLLVIVTYAICLGSYHILVRNSFIGWVLNQ